MKEGFYFTLLALFAGELLLGDAFHDWRWAWHMVAWNLIAVAVGFWAGYWWERRKEKRP